MSIVQVSDRSVAVLVIGQVIGLWRVGFGMASIISLAIPLYYPVRKYFTM